MTERPDQTDPINPIDEPAIAEHPELAGTIFEDNEEDLETSWATTGTALATEVGEDAREDAAADPETVELMEKMVPGSSSELTGEAIGRDPIIEDRDSSDPGAV